MSELDGSVLDAIFEAAVLPELWPAVLDRLASRVGAVGGVLFAVDNLKKGQWTASKRLFDVMERVAESFAERNTRPQRALSKGYAGFMADLDFLTPEEKEEDPLFAELLKPNGLAWACGSVIPVPNGDLLVFDFERATEAGSFDRPSLHLLDGYRPHLARAGVMASRLQVERAQNAAAVMQALGLPGAVLGNSGQVLAMNPLMEQLEPQIYARARDRLTLAHPRSNEILNMALAEIEADNAAVRSIAVPAVEGKSSLVGHIIPIRRQAHDIFSRATTLFVATPLAAPSAPRPGLLCGLFDLTPAEDRVARTIAEGHSVESGAAALSVSTETVRSQLKSVMAKTGTSRQAELVQLLAGTTTFSLPRG
ncbi:helix-turn-helix transcriptional regulator [Mesorhizobium sp.]|uniref:helix-turn-helix transcriptional regulator n=1 Tax=Mesorhizobium sp. TaxID=1871066 RepID=UPI00120040EE|nr:helix-turn-helix transcriptional regulator [Mesorhizobium sp.]TIV59094.1 MAG: helix-turn-helix transcriptional regulator [Mesorhizobium sp.]